MSISYVDIKTKDFLEKVDWLIQKGYVKNDAEVVSALNWNKSVMSAVKNGKLPIPKHVYTRFKETYADKFEIPKEVNDWRDEQIAFLKEQNLFLREQVIELSKKNESNLVRISELIAVVQGYAKTLYQSVQAHRSKLEKVSLEKMKSDMDKQLVAEIMESVKMGKIVS
jgi:hypothetical protein